MHFWINKGSQGCGFNGRYVPPSISSGTRRNQLCGSLYPKPMVTPVHRFQSIESVASGGHRHSRAPPFHTRFPGPQSTHSHINIYDYTGNPPGSASRTPNSQRVRHASSEYVTTGDHNTHIIPVNNRTAKLKCGVWTVIGLIPFFVVGAKYYFNGENMGMEALTFCAILILVLLVGGFLSLFEAFGSKRTRRPSVVISSEQNETFEESTLQVPTNMNSAAVAPVLTELPPPPYHLAVMLPTNNDRQAVIQDSPPPTYEKAVT